MTRPDYSAFGFSVSSTQAKEILGLSSRDEIYDLIRAGTIVALSDFREGRTEPTYIPDELTSYAERARLGLINAFEANTIRAQGILRAYLESHSPLVDFEEADDNEYPVLVGTPRGQAPAVYIRSDYVVDWHNNHNRGPDGFDSASMSKTVFESALKQIGALPRRGFIPLGDKKSGRQRWTMWWRIPQSFIDGTPPVLSRLREGDEIRNYGDGDVVLKGTLTGDRP